MERGFYHIDLEPNGIYHIFSRAQGNELIFKEDQNYLYFLKKLWKYIQSYCDILCFSLLPNHFHLLVLVKDEVQLNEVMATKAQKDEEKDWSKIIIQQFSNFLNAYVKAYNKLYERRGGLFMNRIRRAKVNKDTDLTNFVYYIHNNAVHHNITTKIGEWKYDSYKIIISDKSTNLKRDFIIDWFGGIKNFVDFHNQDIKGNIDLEGF